MTLEVRDFSEVEAQIADKAKFLRRQVIEMVTRAKSGHPGGALGMADIYATLHYHFMRDQPEEPKWPDRDRFLLSNGHICPILYSILADKGYFPEEELWTFRKLGSRVQGHPSTAKGLPGIEVCSGSLGNGLSVAVGTAMAGQLDGKDYRVYCGISDGECQEGQVWEAAMAAKHYQLGNLCAIVDYNKTQIDGPLQDIMEITPFADKWRAFGWNVHEIDGHNLSEIYSALSAFVQRPIKDCEPTIIVAHTTIGKGVSYMEGDYHWHHGYPKGEQYDIAMKELS